MNRIVVKLGGSVLAGIADAQGILGLLGGYSEPLVVVVSALKGVTDRLVTAFESAESEGFSDLLYEKHLAFLAAFEPPAQELGTAAAALAELRDELRQLLSSRCHVGDRRARVLCAGERFSAICIRAAFSRLGRRAALLEPAEIGLRALGGEEDASADLEYAGPRLRASLAGVDVAVVPGFYGVGADGSVKLFGRGGSDYSAAVIAAGLRAASCELVKDSACIRTADPQLVPGTLHVERLSYREAADLAKGGARIIHPRAVQPLEAAKVPLRVIGSRRHGAATLVGPSSSGSAPAARAIALGRGPRGTARLTVAGEGSASRVAVAVLDALHERGLDAKAFSAGGGGSSFRVLVEAACGPDALRAAHEALFGPGSRDAGLDISRRWAHEIR